MKHVKFRGNPRQKDEFRGSNSAEKTQIPRLGSKFRGLRKTVGPSDLPAGRSKCPTTPLFLMCAFSSSFQCLFSIIQSMSFCLGLPLPLFHSILPSIISLCSEQ